MKDSNSIQPLGCGLLRSVKMCHVLRFVCYFVFSIVICNPMVAARNPSESSVILRTSLGIRSARADFLHEICDLF